MPPTEAHATYFHAAEMHSETVIPVLSWAVLSPQGNRWENILVKQYPSKNKQILFLQSSKNAYVLPTRSLGQTYQKQQGFSERKNKMTSTRSCECVLTLLDFWKQPHKSEIAAALAGKEMISHAKNSPSFLSGTLKNVAVTVSLQQQIDRFYFCSGRTSWHHIKRAWTVRCKPSKLKPPCLSLLGALRLSRPASLFLLMMLRMITPVSFSTTTLNLRHH